MPSEMLGAKSADAFLEEFHGFAQVMSGGENSIRFGLDFSFRV